MSDRRQRTELIGVRLTESEREQIERAAATRGLTASALLRECALARAQLTIGGTQVERALVDATERAVAARHQRTALAETTPT